MQRDEVRATSVAVSVTFVAVLAAGCTGGAPEAQEGPTARTVSAECREAFADVAAEPAGDEGARDRTEEPSPHADEVTGAFVDLYGTVAACDTADEWVEAFRGNRMSMTRNADAVATLRSLCRRTHDEQIRDDPVCQEVAVPDPAEDADLEGAETPDG